MASRIVLDFDALSYVCPYFTTHCPEDFDFGCTHPEADEAEPCPETGEMVGRCWNAGQYATVCCDDDATDDEKKLLAAYQRYMHRYDKNWR